PGLTGRKGVRDRLVLEQGRERNPTEERGGVRERLERRSRLAPRLPCPIELACPKVVPADHCPDGPGLWVQDDHRPLVRVHLEPRIDPLADRRLRVRLQGQI